MSSSFTTALYNNPELSGEAFFGTFREQAFEKVKEIIDKPVFKAIDKFSGVYDDTQASATALQEAEAEIAKNAEKYNKYRDLINDGVAEQDRLYDKYQKALNKYNNNQTEGNANAVNDAAKALDKYVNKFKKEYKNTYLPNLDKFQNKYDKSIKTFNDAQETYQDNLGYVLSDIDNLGDEFKPLYDEMNRQALFALKPNFDEAYYREKYGLSEDEDVVQDFFSRENYADLEVSKPKEDPSYDPTIDPYAETRFVDVAPEVDTTAPQIPVLDDEATEENPIED